MLLTMIPALFIWYRVRREPSPMPEQENPTQLKSAVLFGGMYAVVLFALAAVRQYMGGEALYGVAALSGLTDMDAITLSTARMAKNDPWIASEGWRLILTAAVANLVFKAMLVGMLGNRRLLGQIAILFLLPVLGGVTLIFTWDWIVEGYVQLWA